jgi:hypothetical protein
MTDLRSDQPKTRLFARLHNGYKISFGRGKFDDWCIYFQTPSGVVHYPKDSEYFRSLNTIGISFGHGNLYRNFVSLYDNTADEESAKPEIIDWIHMMSKGYAEYAFKIENIFGILYAGMVAEERKENKVLGKRIKRLGMFQLLMDREEPDYAANFSRGVKASQLIIECEKRGF